MLDHGSSLVLEHTACSSHSGNLIFFAAVTALCVCVGKPRSVGLDHRSSGPTGLRAAALVTPVRNAGSNPMLSSMWLYGEDGGWSIPDGRMGQPPWLACPLNSVPNAARDPPHG